MAEKTEMHMISPTAYKLFVAELTKHLADAHATFGRAAQTDRSDFVRLSARFHTIKGGAGFFGLSRIAELAATLEDRFNQADADSFIRGAEARELLASLETASREIPPT